MSEPSVLAPIRRARPLLHCISNIVSANDCANLALAVGASPIMALAVEEMAEITAKSSATVLNTGTPDAAKYEACLLCGAAAQKQNQPVVLDPVGVGASAWRLVQVQRLLAAFTPSILHLNLGEAQALLGDFGQEYGVDSVAPAHATDTAQAAAAALAQRLGTVVLLSGTADIVTDGTRVEICRGGSVRMAQVTGAGCMLSVVCGAFAAVQPDAFTAAAQAAHFWKDCAARAAFVAKGKGNASFHTALLDAAALA